MLRKVNPSFPRFPLWKRSLGINNSKNHLNPLWSTEKLKKGTKIGRKGWIFCQLNFLIHSCKCNTCIPKTELQVETDCFLWTIMLRWKVIWKSTEWSMETPVCIRCSKDPEKWFLSVGGKTLRGHYFINEQLLCLSYGYKQNIFQSETIQCGGAM